MQPSPSSNFLFLSLAVLRQKLSEERKLGLVDLRRRRRRSAPVGVEEENTWPLLGTCAVHASPLDDPPQSLQSCSSSSSTSNTFSHASSQVWAFHELPTYGITPTVTQACLRTYQRAGRSQSLYLHIRGICNCIRSLLRTRERYFQLQPLGSF